MFFKQDHESDEDQYERDDNECHIIKPFSWEEEKRGALLATPLKF